MQKRSAWQLTVAATLTRPFLRTALIFPAFKETVDGLWLWAKGMSDAALGHGLSLQYCMDLPSYALASMELGAVTNARASVPTPTINNVLRCSPSS